MKNGGCSAKLEPDTLLTTKLFHLLRWGYACIGVKFEVLLTGTC